MIDCRDCVKHVYNIDTGKREEYESGDGGMLPIPRGERTPPPPCGECPKGQAGLQEGETPSPDLDGSKDLKWQNMLAMRMWKEIQATYGAQRVPAHLEDCAVFAANMATISQIYKDAENRIKIKAHKSISQS